MSLPTPGMKRSTLTNSCPLHMWPKPGAELLVLSPGRPQNSLLQTEVYKLLQRQCGKSYRSSLRSAWHSSTFLMSAKAVQCFDSLKSSGSTVNSTNPGTHGQSSRSQLPVGNNSNSRLRESKLSSGPINTSRHTVRHTRTRIK